ncbi:MAG: hypothetical protein MUC48_04930 [Leptolyngbya sp. Prado105]|nr:hypothetical protein [Leptolyngbya sp. Prado105]
MPDPDFPTSYDAIDAGVITSNPTISIVLAIMFLLIGWFVYYFSQEDNVN